MSVAPELLMQVETDEWLVDESLDPDISNLITEDDTPVDRCV